MTQQPGSTASGVLCILAAGALLLAAMPLARGSDSSPPSSFSGFEELSLPPGEVEASAARESMLFLPQLLEAVERAKRTGLGDDMRGGMGGMDNSRMDGINNGRGGGPSLSIVNPLDVLRQRLALEFVRRKMRQSQEQILANREMLNSVGKRSVSALAPGGGADLRGLLLRRHVRSARTVDGETQRDAPRQSGGPQPAASHNQLPHSRVAPLL